MQQIIDGIWEKITGAFGTVISPFQWLIDWSPMLGHFIIFLLFVIVCGFIVRFLPDKLKMWLLGAVVIAFAFLAGETNQFRKQLARTKAEREEEKALPKPKPEQEKTFNPFDWLTKRSGR